MVTFRLGTFHPDPYFGNGFASGDREMEPYGDVLNDLFIEG